MSYYGNRRGHHPQWPHFDNRGPDHYYDEERRYEPERRYRREFQYERPYPNRYDSDIYEDEFRREENYYPDYDRGREHWPEDRYYDHRREMRPEENFIERGWHRLQDEWREMRGRGTSRTRYPQDHHHSRYGDARNAENRNRGRWPNEPFRW